MNRAVIDVRMPGAKPVIARRAFAVGKPARACPHDTAVRVFRPTIDTERRACPMRNC